VIGNSHLVLRIQNGVNFPLRSSKIIFDFCIRSGNYFQAVVFKTTAGAHFPSHYRFAWWNVQHASKIPVVSFVVNDYCLLRSCLSSHWSKKIIINSSFTLWCLSESWGNTATRFPESFVWLTKLRKQPFKFYFRFLVRQQGSDFSFGCKHYVHDFSMKIMHQIKPLNGYAYVTPNSTENTTFHGERNVTWIITRDL
jgi:hypothetical protein